MKRKQIRTLLFDTVELLVDMRKKKKICEGYFGCFIGLAIYFRASTYVFQIFGTGCIFDLTTKGRKS